MYVHSYEHRDNHLIWPVLMEQYCHLVILNVAGNIHNDVGLSLWMFPATFKITKWQYWRVLHAWRNAHSPQAHGLLSDNWCILGFATLPMGNFMICLHTYSLCRVEPVVQFHAKGSTKVLLFLHHWASFRCWTVVTLCSGIAIFQAFLK